MNVEVAHRNWLEEHIALRSGERKDRLIRGHGHAEQLYAKSIWWRAKGSFANLHPEYEVKDWRGRSYFLDFAYLVYPLMLGIDVKGYGPHVAEADRSAYSRELNRESFLTALGWRILSFSYDDVRHRPDTCRLLLELFLSRHAVTVPLQRTSLEEDLVMRIACRYNGWIRPIDVKNELGVHHVTAVSILRRLCEKGWLEPSGDRERTRYYRLRQEVLKFWA